MKTVAILGCGPAGLLAAHAVGLAGRPLSLHSRPVKSPLGGAQYLHSSVPMLTNTAPDFTITNRLRGTAEGYKFKVYGDDPLKTPRHVSADAVVDGQEVPVWDLNVAYDTLWNANVQAINEADINPNWIDEHANEFELIISTVPRYLLCKGMHQFPAQSVWIQPGAAPFIPEGEVHYNGERSPAWYRASNINGSGGIEWSTNGPKPPVENLMRINKPLATNCDCYPDIWKVGRFGEWRKGVLAHDAFWNLLLPLKERYGL